MNRPPKLAEALLSKCIKNRDLSESVLGDLSEEHHEFEHEHSAQMAALWYWLETIRLAGHFAASRLAKAARKTLSFFRHRGSKRKGDGAMRTFLRDTRHGMRTWRQKPLFAAMAILTLALGIGLNSAVFSLVDTLLLRPLPIPNLDRLAVLWQSWPDLGDYQEPVSPADFLDWKDQSDVFEPLVATQGWGVNLTAEDEPERVIGIRVSPGFFEALGITLQQGRGFLPGEAEPGHDRSVVLTDSLWSRRFAADPDLVGKTVLLDGESYTVVGVAPESFAFPLGADLWAPLAIDAETAARRTWYFYGVIGRLKPGRTIEDARAEMDLIAKRLALEHPETNEGTGIHLLPLHEALMDRGSKAFLTIWQAAVAFVLLMACVNVANLLLARGVDRHKELALRMALGAGRRRIIRQLMTENLLLSLFGAVLSLPLASIGIDLFRSGIPANMARFVPRLSEIHVDGRAIAFTAAVAVLTSVVFGLLPAWQASRASLTQALKEGGRGSTDGSKRQRGRSALVVAEVAIALMLLVACGLSIQSTFRMLDQDQGYDPDNLMTLDISLPETGYGEKTKRTRLYQDVLTGIRSLPDVVGADAINILPSKGGNLLWPYVIEGHPVRKVDRPYADYRVITPDYFKTLRIPLIAGRHFTEQDHASASQVTIISETMARQFPSGEPPVGKRIWTGDEEDPWMTVVGVVSDVIHDGFLRSRRPTFYRPLAQAPDLYMSLAVRTRGEPESVTSVIRAQVKQTDPNLPVHRVRTMRQVLADRLGGFKLAAAGMGLFGVIALVLSAVGIYGLMTYSVSQQTHAIGIRMVLGAARGDVLRQTVGAAFRLTAIGIGIGLLLALAAGKLMASMPFGAVSLDGVTFAGFTIVLTAVALLAAYIPARRALKVDPAIALREE